RCLTCLSSFFRIVSRFFFFLLTRPPPRSPLFPYTTLFRSRSQSRACAVWRRRRGRAGIPGRAFRRGGVCGFWRWRRDRPWGAPRSEEHTSELQSRGHLVCRLLLEKKKELIKTK